MLSEVCNDLIKDKKTVRVDLDRNEVFPVPHIDDMTDEEVWTIWYDRPDYDQMKQSFIPIIRKMMRGGRVEESDSETTRGLEYRTREGALKRQHNKIESIHAVLDEQERQVSLGVHDVDKIAEAYVEVFRHCVLSARDLGEMDEEFVKYSMQEDSLDRSSHHGKSRKMGGLRKMFRQVRRTSLTWKSARAMSSEKSDQSDPLADPAAEQ